MEQLPASIMESHPSPSGYSNESSRAELQTVSIEEMTSAMATTSLASVDSTTRIGQQDHAHAKRAKHVFPFLKLPGELRNQVYRLALVYRLRISVMPGSEELAQPPLTHVCRQIRSESLPFFYGGNHFQVFIYIVPESTFVSWLGMIGDNNRALIRRLLFFESCWKSDAQAPLRKLRAFDIHMEIDVARRDQQHVARAEQVALSRTLREPKSGPFPILKLPRELRDLFYRLFLISRMKILGIPHMPALAQPPLTRVCRQIRNESLPIFYGGNTFRAFCDDPLTISAFGSWLRLIGNDNCALLRHVCMGENLSASAKQAVLEELRRDGFQLRADVLARSKFHRWFPVTALEAILRSPQLGTHAV
ncbi:hypothetical protein B0A49_02183 [Cryomyces minteri]|uniref:F-box domain-containing protein n=1 Tax=Cryomyces minteri TaxID=331657 RepID=A0A4U0XGB5_9PEZI|nr:hypothetical protein B0A49_02183 [Cryomyces minteri]